MYCERMKEAVVVGFFFKTVFAFLHSLGHFNTQFGIYQPKDLNWFWSKFTVRS
jgi:hypothetical protein